MILKIIIVGVASGAVGIIAGFFLRRYTSSNRRPSVTGEEEEAAPLITEKPSPPPLTDAATSSPEETSQLQDLMLRIVDTMDEMELMKAGANKDVIEALSSVQDRLQDKIELTDGELISEASWHPAQQRAIKVETPEAGQTKVRVLRTRATGLKHKGKIIRKQEVVISQPKT